MTKDQEPETEIARMRRLITEAQSELQYAHVSNCPLFWVKIAQEKLEKAATITTGLPLA